MHKYHIFVCLWRGGLGGVGKVMRAGHHEGGELKVPSQVHQLARHICMDVYERGSRRR